MQGCGLLQRVFLITLALLCFALSPRAQAVVSPPDGGYPRANTAAGKDALLNLTSGIGNTAVGHKALVRNTTGSLNVGAGTGALFSNITGNNNTANGFQALYFNTASGNTAIGAGALLNNTTGGALGNVQGIDVGPNVAVGRQALESNTVASANTALGYQALQGFTTGPVGSEKFGLCTAVGFQALANATGVGFANSAFGYQALMNNTDGAANTAIGLQVLFNNTTGDRNTAMGTGALRSHQTGGSNVAIGAQALGGNVSSSFNIAMGALAGDQLATGDDNIYIGTSPIVMSESGHTYIGNINTTTVSGGGTDTVTINLTTGLLGHLSSSRRYKEDIKPIAGASEALYLLKPVSYRYKKEIDSTQSPAFGLIAEEVADVNSALVALNSEGQPESVHYEMVNAMLLNEFLKEHRKVEKLAATVAGLAATVKEQAAQIQKVSAQLEASKPAPQVVNNP